MHAMGASSFDVPVSPAALLLAVTSLLLSGPPLSWLAPLHPLGFLLVSSCMICSLHQSLRFGTTRTPVEKVASLRVFTAVLEDVP